MTGLVNAEQVLFAIVNMLPCRIVVVNRCRNIVFANRSFLELMRKKEETVIGAPCAALCQESMACPACRVFDGLGAQTVTEELSDEHGSRWIERCASPVLDSQGNIEYVVESLRDITPEHQLAQARAESRAFCHAINNPLFAALGTAELMAEGTPEDSSMAQELAVVIRNLKLINEMTQQMREQTVAAENAVLRSPSPPVFP